MNQRVLVLASVAALLAGSAAPVFSAPPAAPAPAPQARAVTPTEGFAGDRVTISGANFSGNPSDNLVQFESTWAKVVTSTPTSLSIEVPKDAKPGVNRLVVSVKGSKTPALTFKVKVLIPELRSISKSSAPPGTQITITGKNFSQKAGDNKVSFGDASAIASSVSGDSLNVVIPDMNYPTQVNVTVSVNGQRSNALNMEISNREY